ncbi:cysteine rich repeat-containing protein [Candidatus Contendibacter odensensis]|uniref:Cysteine rich repeat protein n=1 Tax=Candidatus Contendobacter odensis Run_B_J11 TaxID=1400861 RepID=A0A7U7GEY1_9GAMM|nr:cysteine rich repeat-containing protein [Candidatus Contendobacter odensis]CDH47133.1 putative Cysteine rich repeat protein [Candidatus Contendobacter odensis Run_B_J11]
MTIRKIALFLLISAAMPAFAQQPSQLDKELAALRTYCKADIERLCPNVEPGGGKIKECLMERKMEVSVGCAQALQKLKK